MELQLESILLPGIEEKRPISHCRPMQCRDRRTSNGHSQAIVCQRNEDIPRRNLETAYQTGRFRRHRRRRLVLAERSEERKQACTYLPKWPLPNTYMNV